MMVASLSEIAPAESVRQRLFLVELADGHRAVSDVMWSLYATKHPETGKPHIPLETKEWLKLMIDIWERWGWIQAVAWEPRATHNLVLNVELTALGREILGLSPIVVPVSAPTSPQSAKRHRVEKPKPRLVPTLFDE